MWSSPVHVWNNNAPGHPFRAKVQTNVIIAEIRVEKSGTRMEIRII
jgi:hypothetical protein